MVVHMCLVSYTAAHLNKCRRMLALSIILPELGSFTGSDIISRVKGSRNSSGGYKTTVIHVF